MPWPCCGRPDASCDCISPQRRRSRQRAAPPEQAHQRTEGAPTRASQEVRGRSDGGRASGSGDLPTTAAVEDGRARHNTPCLATTREAAPSPISSTRAPPVISTAQQISRPSVTTRTTVLSQGSVNRFSLAPPHAGRGSPTPQGASAEQQAIHSETISGMEVLNISFKQLLDVPAYSETNIRDLLVTHHPNRVDPDAHPQIRPSRSLSGVDSRWRMEPLVFKGASVTGASPITVINFHSPWLEDDGRTSGVPDWAQNIRATWGSLDRQYNIKPGRSSKISIMQRDQDWTLSQLKQIAQATIYFEDAWVQLTSIDKTMCRRNWRDNRFLARRSRSQAIAAVGAVSHLDDLIRLIVAGQHAMGNPNENDMSYHLSFEDRVSVPDTVQEVRFISPPLYPAADAVYWTGFTLNFVRSCLSNKNLTRYPTSAEGLRAFVTGRRTLEGGIQ